jgi:DNA-binding CsgD family transcriptional regulator
MINDDDLIELIGGCYAAARDDAKWSVMLARLAQVFAADQCVLLGYDVAQREPWTSIAHGAGPALLERLAAACADVPRLAGPAWSPGKPFAARLRLAEGPEHQLGLVDEIEPNVVLAVGIFRARGCAAFAPEALAALGRIAPHLANAARIMRQLATARATAAAIGETLEKLAAAVMVVDRGVRVVSANRAARALAPVSGLALRDGALRIERPADDRALRAAIAAVLGAQDHAANHDEAPAARDVAIEGAGGRRIMLRVSALGEAGDTERGGARGRALAVVQVLAGSRTADPRAQVLVPAYGLSAAESELLDGLLGGLRLAEIAASRGTSRETTRSQLKSIFHKTGVSTQSDLVALATGAIRQVPRGGMPPGAHGAAVAAR